VLEFRETPVFTREITELLSDEDYGRLQGVLIVQPEAGAVIPGTGGLRKLRWRDPGRGKGKRGGIRVIYYWYAEGTLIYMLLAYSKEESDDLTTAQKRALSRMVTEELK
jgi:mRNA-degrading endonuclease RelE of RelBE toxin-antitoxin system